LNPTNEIFLDGPNLLKNTKVKGKRNLKEETNKQKTGFAITYLHNHKDILNKDKIVLHLLKKRCCAINKCNLFCYI